ncbi:hypothetical protein POM88_018961 [Heracleum sosnowskyi]|uniref:Uncharacterized protein n=1 Tax=Heracleum sosnowskyi TaxID=360622 RepID=A0AAD8N0W0_9APIA|nr:hypothetical protein POM88_018961 [Heracleum sosnowskyi]
MERKQKKEQKEEAEKHLRLQDQLGRINNPNNSAARDMAAILDTALVQALLLIEQTSAPIELLKEIAQCEKKIAERKNRLDKNWTTKTRMVTCSRAELDEIQFETLSYIDSFFVNRAHDLVLM